MKRNLHANGITLSLIGLLIVINSPEVSANLLNGNHPITSFKKISENGVGIRGKVLDLESLQPISGATIYIVELGVYSKSDAQGEFSIPINSEGSYTVETTFLGYNKEVSKVNLKSEVWENVNVALVSETSKLDEVVVTRKRAQIGEIALLEERKISNLMVEKMGAQELARKGASDAESALTKMSGITKSSSDANVFVRGLGDRYNTTTLNGLALPSEDPLNKNISLDFFGTSVIKSVGVDKTFNSLLRGDVAGANIDIQSKELSEGKLLEIGVSTGINTQTIAEKNLKRINGTNWFGSLKDKKVSLSGLNTYDFQNNWNTMNLETPVNSSFSITGGNNYKIGNGNLNIFLTGNLQSDYNFLKGNIRQTITDGTIVLDQKMTKYQYDIAKTGMANLKYSIGNHSVSFNSLYINNQNQELEENYGLDAGREANDKGFFRRQHVINNNLSVNQLLSSLELTKSLKLNLGVGYNSVNSDEPDRRTTRILEDENGVIELIGEPNSHERYYSTINEKGLTSKAIATYVFDNVNSLERRIDFGYQGDFVKRDFESTIFTHKILGDRIITANDINNIDGIFNAITLASGSFELGTLRGNLNPYWYTAKKRINAVILSGTYQFTDKLTSVIGVRYDNIYQDIVYETNLSNTALDGPSQIKKNYILPSVNLKYALTDNSNLRAAASLSYTLPQFVETAYFLNTFSNHSTQGNKDLVPVENTNFDVKWEIFPSQGELFSVGAFYKDMKNPIARSETGTNVMTFFNVGSSATVAGFEVEAKKNLFKTTSSYGDNILSAGANVSYLFTNQKLENPVPIFTKSESALQGASPLLVNADISYLFNQDKWNWTSTVVINYFSDRIYSIGTRGFKDVIEKGIPTLDFISKATIHKNWSIDLKIRNLLNPYVKLERESDSQSNITLASYRRGMDMSLGLSYKF